MEKQLQEKLLAKDKWLRCVFMLLLMLLGYIVASLVCIIAIFQFITNLLTNTPNIKLLDFSQRMNNYLLQIINFLTFNSDSKPFPFNDLPENQ